MSDPSPTSEPNEPRLDGVSTLWTLLRDAHGSSDRAAIAARQALAIRYQVAVRRYLTGLLGRPDEAEELTQDIMVRILSGHFRGANPERGRFRDYLKAAVRNLAMDYLRQRQQEQARHRPMDPADAATSSGSGSTLGMAVSLLLGRSSSSSSSRRTDPARESPPADAELEAGWIADCRTQLLELVWSQMRARQQRRPNSILHTVLRLRADFPDDDTAALANRLQTLTGRSYRIEAVRQQLHRARQEFSHLLVVEVSRHLDEPTPENIRDELRALGLAEYISEPTEN